MLQSSPQSEWDDGTPQTSERRHWIRFAPQALEATWQLLRSTEEWLAAEVQDVSCRGIGMVISRRIQVGAILNVRLKPSDLRVKAVLVRVKHVASLSDEEYQVGGTFVVPLSTEQLQALTARRQI